MKVTQVPGLKFGLDHSLVMILARVAYADQLVELAALSAETVRFQLMRVAQTYEIVKVAQVLLPTASVTRNT